MRESPKSRSDFKVFERMSTRWADIDVYGHVNNVQYYSYFDTAVNRLLISHKMLDPQRGTCIGLVVDTRCSYFESLGFPAELDAGICVASIGNSSIRYEIAIFPADKERAVAQGHFVHVYVDRTSRRPVQLNSAMRDFFQQISS